MEEKFKNLFNRMRNTDIAKKYEKYGVINFSEPGYFNANTRILVMGQNPGRPRPNQIIEDKIMFEGNLNDDEFMEVYLRAQKSWNFYRTFITRFTLNDDFSILNSCFFPTIENKNPPIQLVEECSKYLDEAITLINPKNIILLGRYAKMIGVWLNLKDKYNVIETEHYSYLNRLPFDQYSDEINRIKGELK